MSPEQMVTLAAFATYEVIRARDLAGIIGTTSLGGPARIASLMKLGYIRRVSRGVYEITEDGRKESSIQFSKAA